jgi:hypothetical protein
MMNGKNAAMYGILKQWKQTLSWKASGQYLIQPSQ